MDAVPKNLSEPFDMSSTLCGLVLPGSARGGRYFSIRVARPSSVGVCLVGTVGLWVWSTSSTRCTVD